MTAVTVGQVGQWVIFVGLSLWMLRAGFFGPPRLFTWPMFSRVSQARLELTDPAGQPINPWHDIVHQDPGMNAWELRCYLAYLRDVRGIPASGTVTVTDYAGRQVLTVEAGRVVG